MCRRRGPHLTRVIGTMSPRPSRESLTAEGHNPAPATCASHLRQPLAPATCASHLRRALSAGTVPRRIQLIEADASFAVVKLIVKVHRRIDQGQVSERLREVPLLATGGPDLLGKEAA